MSLLPLHRRVRGQRGSIVVDLVPFVVVLCITALACLQVMVGVWAAIEANSAARKGARAQSLGGDGRANAVAALPESMRGRAEVQGDTLRVSAEIPSVFPLPISLPALNASATFARSTAGGGS